MLVIYECRAINMKHVAFFKACCSSKIGYCIVFIFSDGTDFRAKFNSNDESVSKFNEITEAYAKGERVLTIKD